MICVCGGGGAMIFFACANFFSPSNQKQTFVLSGRETSNFFPPDITPFSASFVNKLYFLQFATQTTFSSLSAEQRFFFPKNPL